MIWVRFTVAFGLAALAGAAAAQAPELQPSAAQQCLTHSHGKDQQPEYPIADSIFGDSAKITVPCLKINLKPQEKS